MLKKLFRSKHILTVFEIKLEIVEKDGDGEEDNGLQSKDNERVPN